MNKVLMKVRENAEFPERKKGLDRNLLNSGGGVSKKIIESSNAQPGTIIKTNRSKDNARNI